MKSEEFCLVINEIDDDYIIKAHEEQKSVKSTPMKTVIALVACLVFGTTTVFAATDFGIRLLEIFAGGEETTEGVTIESGYKIGADVEKIPLKEFSDNIKNIENELKNSKKGSEEYPASRSKNFDSVENAKNFVGLERFAFPAWDESHERRTKVLVQGDISGNIKYVSIGTLYFHDGIWVQAGATAYIANAEDEIIMFTGTNEDVDFKQDIFVNENGIYCLKITSMPIETAKMIKGYLVKDGILYTASFDYSKDGLSEKAEELFIEWANSY